MSETAYGFVGFGFVAGFALGSGFMLVLTTYPFGVS